MNGSAPTAETLRRYPLSWTILACVFQRIPLYPLAKSLADRKFMAVLQQALKDASNPAAGFSSTPSKRKRTPTTDYILEELQSQHGCLETAHALFDSLKTLLDRLEITEGGYSRDKIGAEHIKSLFGTPAAESARIVAPALHTCAILLSDRLADNFDGAQDRIRIISSIWDLHLQGSDDTLEVATHLFRPAATILGRLGAFSSTHAVDTPDLLTTRWTGDLVAFMHRNFILPGRLAFVNMQTFEPFRNALDITTDIIHVSGPALYYLASGVSSRVTEGDLRKNNAEWMKRIFQAVEPIIRNRSDRSTLLQSILELAVQNSTPVDAEDLRRICRDYALQGAETNWQLMSKAAKCEPDIFQLSDEGVKLRGDVCERIAEQTLGDGHDRNAVLDVVGAISEGFRTRRDFPSFLQLWYEQLCAAEGQNLDAHSPWFELAQLTATKQPFHSFVESELSPSQLLDVIAWAEAQKPKSHPKATCVFASTLVQGLRSESFVDAVGRRLFDLVAPIKSSPRTALKWTVVSRTISWVSPNDRADVWSSVKSRMAKILKSSPIFSTETFEAFKCCHQVWDSMYPDDEHMTEAATLVEVFSRRLAAEIASDKSLQRSELSTADAGAKLDLSARTAYKQYLSWHLSAASRFSTMYYRKKEELPPIVANALSTEKGTELQLLWDTILRNEVNLSDGKLTIDLVDRLVVALEDSEEKKGWPREEGQMWINTLTGIPLDAYNRAQRERLMMALSKRRVKMVKSPKRISLDAWKLVLTLETKLMARPTFYPGMSFAHLVELAEAIPTVTLERSTEHLAFLELVERFSLLAAATIRQMAENIDGRSLEYFQGASAFVSDCVGHAASQRDGGKTARPLFMTLLKSLTAELARSPNCHNHAELGPLLDISRSTLAKFVLAMANNLLSDKQLLGAQDPLADMALFAAVDAASQAGDLVGRVDAKSSFIRKLEAQSKQLMQDGDLRGWKIQVLLRYLFKEDEVPRPATYDGLEKLPSQLREPLLKEHVQSITGNADETTRLQYLKELLPEPDQSFNAVGQLLAIQAVVDQLLDSADVRTQTKGFSLAAAHSQLTISLMKGSSHARHICRILRALLEKRPQAMGQWNIELTLDAVCLLSAPENDSSDVPFSWLCKLVEVIIKKHRLRLEGHYHLLLSTIQALLRNLIIMQAAKDDDDGLSQESKAQSYARLITLICEPTAGAVSRSQLHSALDSVTDAAKRSAGRHMYMVLINYVKLQLEDNVPRATREALEPAMNSIFGITSPAGRKILNDAMDESGRAILREMFKRYVKFGKWSGV
ncbi:hypothetical protein RJ55_03038 [Drechmeria coniospora]|nr:hypothetical protein RJ55_03038 [Drechmeria coniospora]